MDRFREFTGRYSPNMAALLVVTIWGSNFVFTKALLAEFDVFAFNFLRFAGMVILGWAVLFVRTGLKSRPSGEKLTLEVQRKDLPRFALSGLLGYTLYIQLSTVGLNYTTAFSNATTSLV